MAIGNKPNLDARQTGVCAAAVTRRTVARCSGVTADGVPEFATATNKDDATITTPHLPVGVFDRTTSAAGEDVDILCGQGSIVVVTAGSSTTEGRLLTFDSAGKAVDIAEVNGQYLAVIGVGLQAAGADGDEIAVLWAPQIISKPAS
jgi:hypothetical protein